MVDCIFCKIVAGEIPSYNIYEDENVQAFLDINPVRPGHVLIISKKHFDDFLQTPDDELEKIFSLAKKIGKKMIDEGIAEGINIQFNNGPAAGQVVNHVHLHLIPRKENDGLELWNGNQYHPGQAEDIAARLKLEE